MYKVIATTKQILQFIHDAGYIKPRELSDELGFTERYAITKITRLHKRGLVDNKQIHGKWNLTEEGERRLNYHGR